MIRARRANGFSLIELLLVLAILGIVAGIAIPSYLGQRRRARWIGDAQANAQVLRMQMEAFRAETGTYGASGATYVWTASGGISGSGATNIQFAPKGNSKMQFTAAIGGGGLTYSISVADPSLSGAPVVYTVNQAGSAVMHPY